jgi:hypothetical protein|nr:MAG TPA: hypothetical protein [Caudoviricetes sp.]
MKINKEGEIKLSKGEYKVGNFIIKDEENHFKIFTANAPIRLPVWSIRYRKDMAIARFIQYCIENLNNENYVKHLHNWLAVMYNVTAIVPEGVFLTEANEAAIKSLKNNPTLYGINGKQLSNEEDNTVLEEEKEKSVIMDENYGETSTQTD